MSVIEVPLLQKWLESSQSDLRILDCRFQLQNPDYGRSSYLEGHIPGAVFVDLNQDLSGPVVAGSGRHPLPALSQIEGLIRRLGIEEGSKVICYDDSDMSFAARAWWILRYAGLKEIHVLNGGWKIWLESGGKVTKEVPTLRPSVYIPQWQHQMLVSAEGVLKSSVLVDSRDPARYRGEVEPIDKKAGHIPGAKNYFYKSNLDSAGRFESPEHIRERMSQQLGGMRSAEAVFYCGSGVTACVNLLAADYSGWSKNSRLYAGSWSEWIADPTRPIRTSES